MISFFESLIAKAWNRSRSRRVQNDVAGLSLGLQVRDGLPSRIPLVVPTATRARHIGVLGKTGSGKSRLVMDLCAQDISENRGWVNADFHGETTSHLLRLIAQEEARRHEDLSSRVIVIDPSDQHYSVGFNVLDNAKGYQGFLKAAEFAQILRARWRLDILGPRTEELLLNSLLVLCDNGLTILELSPLLINPTFRTACLVRTTSQEAKEYFEGRYNPSSEAQQAAFRDPILNKLTVFTGDPHFRHMLGQQQSTFSLGDAIDQGYWIILNLNKGRLGEQAATLGSLFLAQLKYALFARRTRSVFTFYLDEAQNLIVESGLETLLSEARKFSVSVCALTQYWEQYPPAMRAAIQAVGTHVFFQLSAPDAEKTAQALDGGKPLAELLKNLPPRNLVAKVGHDHWRQVLVREVKRPAFDYQDLLRRCNQRWARPRAAVEADIRRRRTAASQSSDEALHDWE